MDIFLLVLDTLMRSHTFAAHARKKRLVYRWRL